MVANDGLALKNICMILIYFHCIYYTYSRYLYAMFYIKHKHKHKHFFSLSLEGRACSFIFSLNGISASSELSPSLSVCVLPSFCPLWQNIYLKTNPRNGWLHLWLQPKHVANVSANGPLLCRIVSWNLYGWAWLGEHGQTWCPLWWVNISIWLASLQLCAILEYLSFLTCFWQAYFRLHNVI